MPNITPNPASGGRNPRGQAAATTRPTASASAAVAILRTLTDRDRYLLDVLAEHQVLTADQITRLKYNDANTARKRLVLLTRRGVLDRFRDGVRPGSQAWRYALGPLGAVIVAAEHARPAPRPAAHAERVLRLARSPRLNHLLGVNDFFVALAHHARRDPAYRLRWWLNEARATGVCAGLAHPDGLGLWTRISNANRGQGDDGDEPGSGGVWEVAFFVEHDEGSEPIWRVAAKLAGYAEASLGGGPDRPVLFWLSTAARETHLHGLLARAASPIQVATANREHAVATGLGPAGPVWLAPGAASRCRLIDLPHDRDSGHARQDSDHAEVERGWAA